MTELKNKRTLGLSGTTFIAIGGIVGGGIFVLGGLAVRETGNGAVLAFALNGIIAILTALSFAELSTLFPESGGPYTYAKKVLSVRAAFGVGWILWFAHLVASLLYALGFSGYALEALSVLFETVSGHHAPGWLTCRAAKVMLAAMAALFYTRSLIIRVGAGGNRANIIKLAVFGLLIIGGAVATLGSEHTSFFQSFTPDELLPAGITGMMAAMGYTFIALQGFDLIGAVAGEVREPTKTIPRSMIAGLIIALLIYLPFLTFSLVLGLSGDQTLRQVCTERPGTCIADTASQFLGSIGYWVVVVGAVLSTLTALYANLLASSRVALIMSQDRTTYGVFSALHAKYGTPRHALILNFVVIVILLVAIPSLAAAGAAASLIFLISFGIAHITSFLARKRVVAKVESFRAPLFPLVQVIGGLACVALAIFQAVAEPSAGIVILVWLLLGFGLYFFFFAARAESLDAYKSGLTPELLALRGFSQFILVPITNPANATALMGVAHALICTISGKALLLNIVKKPDSQDLKQIESAVTRSSLVLQQALTASMLKAHKPAEALLTISNDPKSEIVRVAKTHQCTTILLGLNHRSNFEQILDLENILSTISGDIVCLSAPSGWCLENVKKVLVPIGGRGKNVFLRASLLGSLHAQGVEEIMFASILPEALSKAGYAKEWKRLKMQAQDESNGFAKARVYRSNDVAQKIIDEAESYDLIILGLSWSASDKASFGSVISTVIHQSKAAKLVLGRRVGR